MGEEERNEDDSEVKLGQKEKVDKEHLKKMQEDEEYKLRVMILPRKHRGLYKSMMKNRKKRSNEARHLERKRKQWDEQHTGDVTSGAKKKKKKTTEKEGVAA